MIIIELSKLYLIYFPYFCEDDGIVVFYCTYTLCLYPTSSKENDQKFNFKTKLESVFESI